MIHFGYSWGPCAWILVAEIWPLSNRPYGIALGASSNWMNNFIVGQVTPDMLSGISYGTYIIFGLLTYLGAAFIWWGVPETKRLGCEYFSVFMGNERWRVSCCFPLFSCYPMQLQKFLNHACMTNSKLTNQTVEEMDLVFGSEGVGRGDLERMEAVRREVGLDRILGESNTKGDVSPITDIKSDQAEKIHEM